MCFSQIQNLSSKGTKETKKQKSAKQTEASDPLSMMASQTFEGIDPLSMMLQEHTLQDRKKEVNYKIFLLKIQFLSL